MELPALDVAGWARVMSCIPVLSRLSAKHGDKAWDVGLPCVVRAAARWTKGRASFITYARVQLRWELRRRARRTTGELLCEPTARTVNQWARDEVDSILSKVDEYDRTVLVMHYMVGMTFRDMGEAMGVSKSTARYSVERALRRCREQAQG